MCIKEDKAEEKREFGIVFERNLNSDVFSTSLGHKGKQFFILDIWILCFWGAKSLSWEKTINRNRYGIGKTFLIGSYSRQKLAFSSLRNY